eukprot:tig00001033_g6495.t1
MLACRTSHASIRVQNSFLASAAAQRFTHGVRERVWVVAADRARARVFAVHRPDAEERLTTAEHPEDRFHARDRGLRSHPTEELHEFEDLVAPQSRLPERESRSDDSGRFASRPAPRTSASRRVGSPGQEDDVETERFARQLADTLEEARAAGRMDKFYFAAGPQFIGAFRKELGGRPALRGALVDEVKKSVVDMSTHAIREALGDDLRRR